MSTPRMTRQERNDFLSYHRTKKLKQKSQAEKNATRAERNRRHRQAKKQRMIEQSGEPFEGDEDALDDDDIDEEQQHKQPHKRRDEQEHDEQQEDRALLASSAERTDTKDCRGLPLVNVEDVARTEVIIQFSKESTLGKGFLSYVVCLIRKINPKKL